MKIQDIVFLIAFLLLAFKHNPKWAAIAGIICLALSIPLFSMWVFFTAERLTWYAAAFFLLSILFYLKNTRQVATIFLVRHGEIDNPKNIIYGQNIDLPLNDKGRKQILSLAKTIQKMNYNPSKIFSSPLSRAVDSAKILQEFFRVPESQFVIDRGLADNNIPVFAGKLITELTKLYKKRIDEYDDQFVKKGNESKRDIVERMHAVFQKIVNESLGKTVILVSHGDPVRLLMFKLLGRKLKDIPLSGSKEFREIDYLKKGEAWRIVIDKNLKVIDKELIRPNVMSDSTSKVDEL